MHVREPKLPALEAEGQAFVIDAEQVQNRGLKVVHVNRIFHHVEAKFIALTIT